MLDYDRNYHNDKHSSLLRKSVNYSQKDLYFQTLFKAERERKKRKVTEFWIKMLF